MKRFRVSFSTRSVEQLEALNLYIAEEAGRARAARYIDAITGYCENLETSLTGDDVAMTSSRGSGCSDSGAV